MTNEFYRLPDEERETMYKVPILVSILIAGADNEIDRYEIQKAVEVALLKQRSSRDELIEFYREVAQDFEDKLKILIQALPIKAEERNSIIVEELNKLNTILPKLDRRFAVEFYVSLRDIAKKVAESSGGVLGYMSVGYEESKLMELKMIKDPALL